MKTFKTWNLFCLLGAAVFQSFTSSAQPVITSQPTNQFVISGSNVTLSVIATGVGPLTYRWQFNGTNLHESIITTVAGGGASGLGDGGSATNASLYSPTGVAMDVHGNLFIADTYNNCIRKVSSNGIITTFAGGGASGLGDGGAATNAQLSYPLGLAVDVYGNVFIADTVNNRIREVSTNGIITTFAGGGASGLGDGGAATNAQLSYPFGLAVDVYGNVFIADTVNSRIREVSTNGIITTVMGNGSLGYSGDGGAATNASLNSPQGIALDAYGNMFIADTVNKRIREVSTNGIITTVAGGGASGLGDGGAATNAVLSKPQGLALDAYGNMFIADSYNNRIREVSTNGIITTVAGNGSLGYSGDGGAATNASLNSPQGIALDAYGNMFIADSHNNRIREVATSSDPTLTLTNVSFAIAGNYSVIVSSLFGSVTSAVATVTVGFAPTITTPPVNAIVIDGNTTNLSVMVSGTGPFTYQWLFNGTNLTDNSNFSGSATSNLTLIAAVTSDAGNYSAMVSSPYGSVTSVVATVTVVFPPAITTQPVNTIMVGGYATNLSVAVSGTGPFTYQWLLNGTNLPNIIRTIAGNGSTGYSGDGGAATNANFYGLSGLAVDAHGNVFIADRFNNRVREVQINGIITTVVGNGSLGYSGDGGAATNAELFYPSGVAVDAQGNLFIGEFGNNVIRKVGTNGIITTFAGGGSNGLGDGSAATNASLSEPLGVALDVQGNLFIADFGNNRVRKVDTNGIITTVAGNGSPGFSGDGGLAINAQFRQGGSLALDAQGNLFIADFDNNRIRKVGTNGIITTFAGNGSKGYSGDGGAATNASLNGPGSVAVDAYGNVFISDGGNGRIRKVDANGIITTFAGGGSKGLNDGGAATDSSFWPGTPTLDAYGDLFFPDISNYRIREVTTSAGPTLALRNAGAANAGNYSVIISSPYASVTSSIVTVAVIGPPLDPVWTSNGNINLTWRAIPSQKFQVQYATNLNQASWVNLGSLITATNGTVMVPDATGSNLNRFYRIQMMQ